MGQEVLSPGMPTRKTIEDAQYFKIFTHNTMSCLATDVL